MKVNREPLVIRLAILFSLAAFLVACGGASTTPLPNAGTSTISGSLGVASQRSTGFATASVQSLTIQDINAHLSQMGQAEGLSLASNTMPVRGLNAAVLGNTLTNLQTSNAKPLFSLTNQSVVAVNKAGDVLGSAAIQADGSWSLDISNETWQKAGTIGLLQGYESNEGWVCEKPLEYEDDNGEGSPALFGYDDDKASLRTQQIVAAGLFNYDPDTGNPTSDDEADIEKDDSFEPKCEGANVRETSVTADFFWQTPSSLAESEIYTTGVAYAIDTRDQANPGFVNVAPLNAQGVMNMPIFKPEGSAPVPMALVISDTDMLELNSLDEVAKISMPLTPTFDLNAAIRYSNPSEPAQIAVGDSGYAYDPNLTRGGMAYLQGTVRGSDGTVEPNALVIGMIDSADIIAFNLAVSRADGSYELMLPATSPDLPYYIIAISSDETEVGIPANVPTFAGDPQGLKFSLTSPLSVPNADIQLIGSGGTEPQPGEGSSISGTLTAPAGQDVSDSVIFVCELDLSNCPASTQVSSSSNSAPFSVESVPAGQFAVIAQKDLDGDKKADLIGFYTTDGKQPAPVTAGTSGLAIEMIQVGSKSEPGSSGTISGTVFAPQGKDVKNTGVYACFIENEQCSQDKSKFVVIRDSGSQGSYQITDLLDGDYVIYADKDVNLDKKILGEGDYTGCYTNDPQTCLIVKPGNAQIDIQMFEIQGEGSGPDNPNPDNGDTEAAKQVIAGRVSASGGQNLQGGIVYACDATTQGKCDWGTIIQESGSNTPYAIPSIPAGSYRVFASIDLDGDKTLSVGDLIGCAGGDPFAGGCQDVTGPSQNINFSARAITQADLDSLNAQALGTQALGLEFLAAPSFDKLSLESAQSARPLPKQLERDVIPNLLDKSSD